MNRNEFLKTKDDGVNLMPMGTDPQEALNVLCKYLLGDDWCIADPVNGLQANTHIVAAIMDRYPDVNRKNKWRKIWDILMKED